MSSELQVNAHVFGVLGALAWLCMASQAFAQSAPVTLTNNVFQEVEVLAEDGTLTTELVPAARVVPGDEVIYELAYGNAGEEVVTDVVIDNPLPEHLELVSQGDTLATAVSVDGGVTYGRLEDLFVLGADGEPRPARVADVTHLRWVIAELAPGATGRITYRARVR